MFRVIEDALHRSSSKEKRKENHFLYHVVWEKKLVEQEEAFTKVPF